MLQSLLEWEGQLLVWIQENLRSDMLTPVMKGITSLGNAGIFWILLAVFLLTFKKTRSVGVISVMGILGSAIVNNLLLKPLVDRIRPYEVVEGLVCLIGKQEDASFPSGHTGVSFAVAVVLFKELPKKYGIPALVLASLIALSRLYVGVHFPTDVLGGMLSGIGIALFSCWLYHKNEAWLLEKIKQKKNRQ